MELARKSSTLKWWDFIWFKIVKATHETRWSLDQYDSEYFMNLYEAISLEEYTKDLYQYDMDEKRETERVLTNLNRMGN